MSEPLTPIQEIEKRGANARAHGLDQLDNPYIQSEAAPGTTDEDPKEWGAKAAAWDRGWMIEDAIRGE